MYAGITIIVITSKGIIVAIIRDLLILLIRSFISKVR